MSNVYKDWKIKKPTMYLYAKKGCDNLSPTWIILSFLKRQKKRERKRKREKEEE